MVINRASLLTSVATILKSLNAQQVWASVCSGVKRRMVSVIHEHLGLAGAALTGSFIFGISIVGAINHYYPVKRELQDRCKWLKGVEIAALAVTGGAIFNLVDRFNFRAVIILSLATGFILGMETKKWYARNNDQKIIEFVKKVKLKFDENNPLYLSNYISDLRYFNLTKLGEKVQEIFKSNSEGTHKILILSNCQLENSDLKRLGTAGWFSYFQEIDLSNNTRLTHSGLKEVAKAAGEKLEILNLSRIDLTDRDLEYMADSGYFKDLKALILHENPRLTGKGIGWIANKGFESLERLDLAGNSQVLKMGFNDWLKTNVFKNLKVLDLSATDLGRNELDQMIEKTDWCKKLKGLNVSLCTHLKEFPPNISMLTQLDAHGVTSSVLLSGGGIYYHNQGLFFRGCSKLNYTPELFNLVKDDKAFGGKGKDEGLIQKAGRELDVHKMLSALREGPSKE